MQRSDTDSEIQRSSETLMLRGRRWSGDGEVKSRAERGHVTLWPCYPDVYLITKPQLPAGSWLSLVLWKLFAPSCRDFSKVVLLDPHPWHTGSTNSFQFTGETQVSMNFNAYSPKPVSRTVPCFRQKGNMACFFQGKVLNDKAREKWIINIIQSMLKSIDTKISQSILA